MASQNEQRKYPVVAIPTWLFEEYLELQRAVEFTTESVNSLVQADFEFVKEHGIPLTLGVFPTNDEVRFSKTKDERGNKHEVRELNLHANALNLERGQGEFVDVKRVRVTSDQYLTLRHIQSQFAGAGFRLSISTILGGILEVARCIQEDKQSERFVGALLDGKLHIMRGVVFKPDGHMTSYVDVETLGS